MAKHELPIDIARAIIVNYIMYTQLLDYGKADKELSEKEADYYIDSLR